MACTSHAAGEQAAVDDEVVAAHGCCMVACQEQDRRSHVLSGADMWKDLSPVKAGLLFHLPGAATMLH